MTFSLKIPEPIWITNAEDLAAHCAHWRKEPYISIDTEFVRTKTFYPCAGLIQIADKQHCYLIDPLEIDNWQSFSEFLSNPLVIKVFHACAEDLELLQNLTGVLPAPIADTQLGAALAGVGGMMGFQRLVKAVLNIELDKGETRSNWLQRPLSPNQIRYAVADVHYLHKLYPKLVTRLKSMGRITWWHEDSEQQLAKAAQNEEIHNYYRRIKLAWKLKAQEQYVLQCLAEWREVKAREVNVPRGKVIDDSVLWNLARYKVQTHDGLQKSGVRGEQKRQYGPAILEVIEEALATAKGEWQQPIEKPLGPAAGDRFKELKKVVADKAEILEIPADILVKKKTLESLLRSGYPRGPYELPEPLMGWRKKEIADYLLVLLQEDASPLAV